MIRSLRVRAFLITWPLVVAATAAVSLTFLRWTRVELDILEDTASGPAAGLAEPMMRSLTTALASSGSPEAALERAARGTDLELAFLDPRGELLASTDARLELVTPGADRGPGRRTFVRSLREGIGRIERTLEVSGHALDGPDGHPLGFLYVLPVDPGDAASPAGPGELGTAARRMVWTTFLVASAAAAAAALLLAGPLVSQIGRLSEAAMRLRRGDLEARVRPRGQDELGRLERSFNDMAEALERGERLKRDLVADVAHELRAPATNLLGLLEAIEDGLLRPDRRTLELLGVETRLLAALVQDLHDLSLADAGQLDLDVRSTDVAAVAASAVEPFRAAYPAIRVEGPDLDRPVHALADPRRLEQAVRNLLRNALAHTPPGGRVRVELEGAGASVALRVRDTGAGIPPEHLPLIWERFHRVDASRSRDRGGRGLGLALVRKFVEGMDGSVSVTSEVGVGSCFELRLRAACAPAPVPAAAVRG